MKRLKDREKIMIVCGVTLLGLLLVYRFVLLPMGDRMELLDGLLPKKEKELQEIIHLKNTYEALKLGGSQRVQRIKGGGEGAVTLSYLEDLAKNADVKNNIQHMKPLGKVKSGDYVQHSIELKLSKIPMEGLVRLLYDIENSERDLRITELNILTNKRDSSYIDVKIQITSFEST